MSREEKYSLNLQGRLSNKLRKKDVKDFISFMKQMDNSDWTDEQKVHIIKITCSAPNCDSPRKQLINAIII